MFARSRRKTKKCSTRKRNWTKHTKALKEDGLSTKLLEDQLRALKVPDVVNNHLKYKTSLDARLLEIEQKVATTKSQFEAALLKLDQNEREEEETLDKETEAWRIEFEVKRDVAQADRDAAKAKYISDRPAPLEKDRLRTVEQEALTVTARESLLNLGQAAHPTLGPDSQMQARYRRDVLSSYDHESCSLYI